MVLKYLDVTVRKIGSKKVGSEVKTFPVPLALGEIKEDIAINTFKPRKYSKEEISNQALNFHLQGNFKEAAKYYQSFMDQGFTDHGIFSNYGIVLINLDRLHEAEILHRMALELKPDFADAHSNLGLTLKHLGKFKEAEISFRKAIDIKPNFAEAHNNLGTILKDNGRYQEAFSSYLKATQIKHNYALAHNNLGMILRDLGKLNEAEISTRKAIKIDPDMEEAYLNLAMILRDLGKYQEAFDSYIKVIEINQDSDLIYVYIVDFLFKINPNCLKKDKLKSILTLLLNKDKIDHSNLFMAFRSLYNNQVLDEKYHLDINSFQVYINDDNFIMALKKIIFRDQVWEQALTKIRRLFCEEIGLRTNYINEKKTNFIIALAEQCFLNEYVFFLSEKEIKYLDLIIDRCNIDGINNTDLSILACYYPLHELTKSINSIKSYKPSNLNLRNLIKLQIIEPLEEFELSKEIRSIGAIENKISQKVRSQYEENPYPRWKDCDPAKKLKLSVLEVINSEIKPNRINDNIYRDDLRVLIAGCGTGKQIVYAQRYLNADITAIDLSLASLSYTKRKLKDLNIRNVELIHMDILDLGLLKKDFDVIECCGVLHHMYEPDKGLKSLLSVLKDNGLMRLSLYSELARKNVIESRKYIKEINLTPNIKNIRDFRFNVFSGKFPKINSLCETGSDFYTTSEVRDLCFHYQEHQYRMDEIEQIINSNGLRFNGFLLKPEFKSLYANQYLDDKTQTNFKYLKEFEINYPQVFANTPPFWVSKV